jgi:hypothetical protein
MRVHAGTGGNHHVLMRGLERPLANSATLDCVDDPGRTSSPFTFTFPGSGQSTWRGVWSMKHIELSHTKRQSDGVQTRSAGT